MPAVSIIIVTHRVQPYLTEAVASVRAQTWADWELVLVDNGTGLGRRLLTDGAAGDPRIRVVALPENRGIAHGINAGTAAAAGRFIALLDHDDVALPRRLERQVELLESDPTLGLVNCAADTIDTAGRVIGREFGLLKGEHQQRFSDFGTGAVAPTYTGRREVFERYPHRPEFAWGSDFDHFARAAEEWRLGGVSEVLLRYRRHPEQVTVRHRCAQIAEECAIRLLVARRRARRAEGFDALAAELASWRGAPLNPGETYRHFAHQSMEEDFPMLAVFHARRWVAAQRRAKDLAGAASILWSACQRHPSQASFLFRLFVGGPLRAHGLRDEARHLPAPA